MTIFVGYGELGNKAWGAGGGTQQPQSGGGRTSHSYEFITTISTEAWESCRVGRPAPLCQGLFGGDLALKAMVFLQPVNQMENKEKCNFTITTCALFN